MSRKLTVVQLVDSLDPGGAERMAVQIANELARRGHRSILATSRRDGGLDALVAGEVGRLRLGRRGRFDLGAILRLRRFLRDARVDVVHAHTTSLFLALAATAGRRTVVVWHDHFGRWQTEERPRWLYGPTARACHAIVAVHPELARWSVERLGVAESRVLYLPNFIEPIIAEPARDLPGEASSRVVCVANFRAQKDHPTLLEGWTIVVRAFPDAQLLLVGATVEPEARREVDRRLATTPNATLLGERSDVPAVLAGCAIGVLSSRSEGMPLVLLEYGAAGLATVATSVGACPEVVAQGRAGLLVPPGDPAALAEAITRLLSEPGLRADLGERLSKRVRKRYGATGSVDRLLALYESRPRERAV